MLDTDVCSYLIKGTTSTLDRRVAEAGVPAVCASVVTKGELFFGVAVSPRPEGHARAVGRLLRYLQVLDLPESAAEHYADIRAELGRRGTPIGGNDLWIAAHARSLDLTLVTNNAREFSRVTGLRVENWME